MSGNATLSEAGFISLEWAAQALIAQYPDTKGCVVNLSSSAHAISPFRAPDTNFISSMNLPSDEQPSRSDCEAFETPWVTGHKTLVAYAQSQTTVILHAN